MTFLDAIAFASLQLNHSLRFGEMPGMCSILQHASACDVYVQSSFDITAFAVLTPWHLNDICVTVQVLLCVNSFRNMNVWMTQRQRREALFSGSVWPWPWPSQRVLEVCGANPVGPSCHQPLTFSIFQSCSLLQISSYASMVETCWNTNSCFAK